MLLLLLPLLLMVMLVVRSLTLWNALRADRFGVQTVEFDDAPLQPI